MTDKHSPQLKFSNTNWKRVKLGDLYTERKEKGNDTLPILSVSIHTGISDKEMKPDSLGKTVNRSEDKSLYKHIYQGDLVLNMMRAWQGAYGVAKVEGMVSPAYITAYPNAEVFPTFMNYYLKRESIISQINNLSYGVTDFRKRLYWGSFVKVSCLLPPIIDQEKITNFFEHLETVISLHQQELDALKQTKQGFLQRMFPKDGETVPEVRLPSFSDEWVPWKLSDITDLITKGTTPKNMSNEGLINFVKVENINPFSNQITSYSKISLEEHNGNLKRSQLKKNDILFSIAGTLGRTAIVKEKDLPANTNQALAILRMKNTNIDFITTYLKGKLVKDYIRKNPTIGAQPNLSLQQLKDLHVFLPSNQEQIKIGTFFRQIDEVIELKEQELEALKQTKKGFLQKMFV